MALQNLPLFLPLPETITVPGRGAAIATILGLFFSYLLLSLLNQRRISARFPPGPYAWPIIGNLHQLVLPAHRGLKGLADKYGPILFLRLGSVPTVLVSSSEFAKLFLKTHDLVFASRYLMAAEDAELHVQDFVDVLLHMAKTDAKITRETIKALLLDMFAAGFETTSTTLEWTISELLRNPRATIKLQKEIDSVVGQHGRLKESDLSTMKYLHCVLKETLRLYPAAPLGVPHESAEAVTVGGYYIPQKTTVIINLWAIGRDPNVWGADASEFKPERFMEEEHINLTEQSDFSMIPFGAGRRGCPGASMAIPTIELAVAQLLHSFDWKVEGDPSKLDMNEACGGTISRLVPLCAYPSLRVNCPP